MRLNRPCPKMSPVAEDICTNVFMPERLVPIISIALLINGANLDVIAGTIYYA